MSTSNPHPTTPTPPSRTRAERSDPTSQAQHGDGAASLTALEREVLDEYGLLLSNLNEVGLHTYLSCLCTSCICPILSMFIAVMHGPVRLPASVR